MELIEGIASYQKAGNAGHKEGHATNDGLCLHISVYLLFKLL